MTTTTDCAALQRRAAEDVQAALNNWQQVPSSQQAEERAAWHTYLAALARFEAVNQAARAKAERGQGA